MSESWHIEFEVSLVSIQSQPASFTDKTVLSTSRVPYNIQATGGFAGVVGIIVIEDAVLIAAARRAMLTAVYGDNTT